MADRVIPTGDDFPDYHEKVYIHDDSLVSGVDSQEVADVVSQDEWDDHIEKDILVGRLDEIASASISEVIEDGRILVEQEPPRMVDTPVEGEDTASQEKPRVGRPRSGKAVPSSLRKKLWKQRHGEDALRKEREYQRSYRKRKCGKGYEK